MLRARSTTSVPTQLYYVPTPFYWINFQFFLKFTTNKEAHSALEKLQQSQMQLAVCTVNREGQPGHQLCFGKCRSCFTATQEDDWNIREHMFAQQTLIQCFTLPFMTHIAAIQERKKQMFSETSPWHPSSTSPAPSSRSTSKKPPGGQVGEMPPPPPNGNSPRAWPVGAEQRQIFGQSKA